MTAWWNSLTQLQQVLAFIAVPATLILVLQTLLSVLGIAGDHEPDHDVGHGIEHDGGHETGHDADDHGSSGLKLLTFRGVIAFLAVYGWGALAISRAGHPWLAAIGFGLLMGFSAMLIVAAVMKFIISMQSNGAIELENAVGLDGTVYLTVPPTGSGKGKVNVLLQERYVECDAITEESVELATGTEITVTGLADENVLVVSRKNL